MSYKVYNNYSEQDKESMVIAKLGEVEDAIKDLTSVAGGQASNGESIIHAHNISVNHTTSSGTWDYVFMAYTHKTTEYSQLAEVANDIHSLTPGISLIASGTYVEGNNVYVITKINDLDSSMIQVEMRKLSDGSRRVISTGVIDVIDTIIGRM